MNASAALQEAALNERLSGLECLIQEGKAYVSDYEAFIGIQNELRRCSTQDPVAASTRKGKAP